MKLIFVGGNFVKRISGDAVPDVEGAMVMDETPEVAGAPLSLIKLIDGVVTVVAPTPVDPAILEAREQLELVTRKMFHVALNHENRIRALEGKPAVTAAQFKPALIAL